LFATHVMVQNSTMTQEATGAIILSPRLVATGDPAGEALENLNTEVLGDGAICTTAGTPGTWKNYGAISA
jgi:hypothetical protein